MKCWGRPNFWPFKVIILILVLLCIGIPGWILSFITIGMFKSSCVDDFLNDVADWLEL